MTTTPVEAAAPELSEAGKVEALPQTPPKANLQNPLLS
jgi:hypothetical protein